MATDQLEQQKEEQEHLLQKYNQHLNNRCVNFKYPAEIASHDQKPLRTNKDLVQRRLIEAGVSYGDREPLRKVQDPLNGFIQSLEASGCYDVVHARIEQVIRTSSSIPDDPTEQLNITLKEKNWYKLYVGGGIRNNAQAELGQMGGLDFLAKTQFETLAGLKNITGYLDSTILQYTVDAMGQSRWELFHVRPLDGILLGYKLAHMINASQYSLGFHAALDTLDFEWTRSYRERQRKLSVRLSNHSQVPMPQIANGPCVGFEWSWIFRDLLPRRHSTLPYAMDASPEIAAQSGPSEKNALTLEYRTNGSLCDEKMNPEEGIDYYCKAELAGPPGDVGFVKAQGGGALHVPISIANQLHFSLHGSFQTGLLRALSFGGACQAPKVSDRYFAGGPPQLRGFCPAGIGPRAEPPNRTSTAGPHGDALGGDFFYTASVAASTTTMPLVLYGLRVMAFGNIGTLVGSMSSAPSWRSVVHSSRASVGVGICGGSPMGRVEAAYTLPLRFGPYDMRKNAQISLGFSFE